MTRAIKADQSLTVDRRLLTVIFTLFTPDHFSRRYHLSLPGCNWPLIGEQFAAVLVRSQSVAVLCGSYPDHRSRMNTHPMDPTVGTVSSIDLGYLSSGAAGQQCSAVFRIDSTM